MGSFVSALARVPYLLAADVLLAAAALLAGLAISLPLAILSARHANVARVALGFASLVQTIPSLALLALFYPLLLWLSALVGGGIPALGRSEEHTSELQSLMRISYAVFCLKNKNTQTN